MRMKKINTSMTELNMKNGTSVLFSYETPVAIAFSFHSEYFYTKVIHSRATENHLKWWIKPGKPTHIVEQEFFNKLVLTVSPLRNEADKLEVIEGGKS